MADRRCVLVTGATGYVGSRLVPLLLESGYLVRAVGRSLEKLRSRPWASHPAVELVAADIDELVQLEPILENCDSAYYLVHSMNSQSRNFAEKDSRAAKKFLNGCERAGVKRLIYLGGLGELDAHDLSKHLKSRHEVADIFLAGSIQAIVLRAAMIIGSGSASFEILRYLVERLPVMVTPRWVSTPCQPIAIRNVLNYLIGCLEITDSKSDSYDIGGPEVLSYSELMSIYASEANLAKRKIIPVPVFTPRLSSYWIHFVTPVPSYIARPLAEGLKNPVVCQDKRIVELIPQQLLDCRAAIRLAIDKTQHHQVASRWTDAGKVKPAEWTTEQDPSWAGGTVYSDVRTILVEADPEKLWNPLVRLGGENGWYYGNWLWWLRGAMDLTIGGVGLKRGRRHPTELYPGDVLDFWRVQAVDKNCRLLLTAEMKLPGEAVLEFRISQEETNRTRVTQIAKFHPTGLAGIAYWCAVKPLHDFVFSGMLRGIAKGSGCRIIEDVRSLRGLK
ncbi:MAG TPA: SDR family oxidoreductase [Oculatellaceae cyanobacterium]